MEARLEQPLPPLNMGDGVWDHTDEETRPEFGPTTQSPFWLVTPMGNAGFICGVSIKRIRTADFFGHRLVAEVYTGGTLVIAQSKSFLELDEIRREIIEFILDPARKPEEKMDLRRDAGASEEAQYYDEE